MNEKEHGSKNLFILTLTEDDVVYLPPKVTDIFESVGDRTIINRLGTNGENLADTLKLGNSDQSLVAVESRDRNVDEYEFSGFRIQMEQ